MDLDLHRFAPSLRLDERGIWVSERKGPVSYPSDGHATCFQVENDSFWFHHRNAILLRVMDRLPPPEKTLFDVGGGNGFVARALQDGGWRVVLVEPGPVGAMNARVGGGVAQIVCARLEDAGFEADALPAIGLFDVLEHVEGDHDFLMRARALLRPGGRLFLTVPAYPWLWSAEDDDAGHFRRYNQTTLCAALARVDLKMEFCSYFFSILPLPILLGRSLPSRLGLRRRATIQRTAREHTGAGTQSRLLRGLLTLERQRLAAGKRIPFGSSLIAVARK